MTTLDNRQYFPAFSELPLMDEFCDPAYYVETADGKVVPTKTWCFFAEIVDNSLSQVCTIVLNASPFHGVDSDL